MYAAFLPQRPVTTIAFVFSRRCNGRTESITPFDQPLRNPARLYSRNAKVDKLGRPPQLVICDYQLANFALGRISATIISVNSNLTSLPCLGRVSLRRSGLLEYKALAYPEEEIWKSERINAVLKRPRVVSIEPCAFFI
jgi:hypothetical protein